MTNKPTYNDLYRLYVIENKTVDEVAQIYDMPRGTMAAHIHKLGLKKSNPRDYVRLDIDQYSKYSYKELYRLYITENKTANKIGHLYGVSEEAIIYQLTRRGIRKSKLPPTSIEIKNRYTGKCIYKIKAKNLCGVNLLRADLREADLHGVNLGNANLQGAYLYNADLRNANLRNANLRGACLYNADLRGADLYGADMYNANTDNAMI